MNPATAVLERLRKKNHGALALAERAALAAWVEPELLRALRLDTLPGIGAAAEADLWFSELVSARSSSALVLRAEYLEPLRQWAVNAPEELERAKDLARTVEVIRRMHANSPELIQREERLIAGVLARTLSAQDTQHLLLEILATLLEDPSPARRDAIASWALGAWPRLPSGVRHSSAGLQLLVAANQRRGGYLAGPSIALPDETLESFYKGLLGTEQRRVFVEVAWLGQELVLRQVQKAGPATIEVPGTMPVLVEIISAQRRSLMLLRPQEPGRTTVEGDSITLRTLDARSYQVERPRSEQAPQPARRPAAGSWRWSKKWISVVGTGLGTISEQLRQVAVALGQGLAREGHGLVIGGWPGIDEIVGAAYSEELRGRGGDPLLYVAVLKDLTQGSPGPEGASSKRRRQPRFTEPAFQADALILLGGESGVWSIFGAAQDLGRPVLTLPATGGSAERVFTALHNAFELHALGFGPPSSVYTAKDLQRLNVPLGSGTEIQHAVSVLLQLIEKAPARIEPYASALLLIMTMELPEEDDDLYLTVLVRQLIRHVGLRAPARGEVGRLLVSLLPEGASPDEYEALERGAQAQLGATLPAMSARLLEDFQRLGELGEFGLRVQARLSRQVVESSGRDGLEAVGRVASRHRLARVHPALRRLLEGARGGFVSEERFHAWVADTIKLSWAEYTFRELVERLAGSFEAGISTELIRQFYQEDGGRPEPDYVRYYLNTRQSPGQRAMAYFLAGEYHLMELRDRLLHLLPLEEEQFVDSKSPIPLAQLLDALQVLGISEHLRTRAGKKTRQGLESLREALENSPGPDDPGNQILDRCNLILGVDEPQSSWLRQPTERLRAQLRGALLNAYPTIRELQTMLLMEEWGRDLLPELDGESLSAVVYELIELAVRKGSLGKLILKAFEGKQANPLIKDLYNAALKATPKEVQEAPSDQAVDIGVLLTLPEEFLAFKELIPVALVPSPDRVRGQIYHTFETPDGRYKGAVTAVNEMGPTGPAAATFAAVQFMQRWKPRLIVHLGLAAAVEPRLRAGDVVVPTRVHSQMDSPPQEGQYYEAPSQLEAPRARESIRYTDYELTARTLHFKSSHQALFERWSAQCRSSQTQIPPRGMHPQSLIENGTIRDAPEIHAVTLLSANNLELVQKDFPRLIRTRDRGIGAVDMESAALIAAIESDSPQIRRILILCGVSDYVDDRRMSVGAVGPGLRGYAMRNTITLFWALLQAGLVEPSNIQGKAES